MAVEGKPYDPADVPRWTHEDTQLAAREGWRLDYVRGRIVRLFDRRMSTGEIEDPPSFVEQVKKRADEGSVLHAKALRCLTISKIERMTGDNTQK